MNFFKEWSITNIFTLYVLVCVDGYFIRTFDITYGHTVMYIHADTVKKTNCVL